MTSILRDEQNFFRFYEDIDAHNSIFGNFYEIDWPIELEGVFQLLSIPVVDMKLIAQEKRALRDELRDKEPTSGDKLCQIGGEILYDKKFHRSHTGSVNSKQFVKYLQTYVQPKYMLICNDNYVIQHRGAALQDKQVNTIKKVTSKVVRTKGDTYIMYVFSGYTKELLITSLFTEFLLDAYGNYHHRLLKGNYNYPIGNCEFYAKGVMLAYQKGVFDIDKEWFKKVKQLFLREFQKKKSFRYTLRSRICLYGIDLESEFLKLAKAINFEDLAQFGLGK